MGADISGKFKKNMKSERYIAHSGTLNPKRRNPHAFSQWHSVDQQSSRNVRNFNDTLRRTVGHSTHKVGLLIVISQWQSVDQQSSRNIRNVNVTLRTQWDIQSKSKIRNITSQWQSVDQQRSRNIRNVTGTLHKLGHSIQKIGWLIPLPNGTA